MNDESVRFATPDVVHESVPYLDAGTSLEVIDSITSKISNPHKLPRRWGARLRNWRTALHRGRARGATIVASADPGEYIAHEQAANRVIGAFVVARIPHRPSRSKYTPHVGEKQLRKSWKEVVA